MILNIRKCSAIILNVFIKICIFATKESVFWESFLNLNVYQRPIKIFSSVQGEL